MAGLPWSTVYIGIAAYAITRSTVGMFFLLSIVATVAKLLYKLTLYPAYFSSIGHIPTPPVSQFSLSRSVLSLDIAKY